MNTQKFLLLTGVAAFMVATGSSQLANAGIDAGGGPGSSSGAVSRFGSIFVNGVRFNTDNAVFIIDRRFGSESDLEVGQVVSVYGSVDRDGENGTAWIVSYDDAVEGPISKIDVKANRLSVLGQTVIVNNDTFFSMASNATSIGDLHKKQVIEVSGFVDANGNIVATYIGDSDGHNGLELTGKITAVNAGRMTFAVNDLQVNYRAANLYNLSHGMPTVGEDVEIAGSRVNAKGQLVAEAIWAAQQDINPGSNASGEVEGYITERRTFAGFEVNGTPVRVTWDTLFVNGGFFSLRLNRKVEVEGRFNGNGVLVAEKIKFERGARLRQRGSVDAVTDDHVYVNGTAIRVTAETKYRDGSVARVRRFNIGDLSIGDVVEVRGYQANGDLVATRLKRHDSDDYDSGDDDSDDRKRRGRRGRQGH